MPVQVLEYGRRKKRGRLHFWIAVAVVISGVFLIGQRLPKLLIWTRWSCTHYWCDVTSGRIKVEDWAYFRKRGETIRDTPFTELYRELIGEPPDPDFTVLTPDSLHADGIDNDGDGDTDEAGETAFNSRYNIDYFYEIEHLPDDTSKVAGSGANYKRHFFLVTSDAKRRELNNETAEVVVSLSKIYPTGYN